MVVVTINFLNLGAKVSSDFVIGLDVNSIPVDLIFNNSNLNHIRGIFISKSIIMIFYNLILLFTFEFSITFPSWTYLRLTLIRSPFSVPSEVMN